jgi:general L-amino acid transport system permease protein
LGFFIGLARLSENWLLRKLSTIYIETFRNIPPLLQIFFWYFAVLRNLPGPRQAVDAFDLLFLSNRGLYIPSPQAGEGLYAFMRDCYRIALSVGLFRYNRKHQIKTGQRKMANGILSLVCHCWHTGCWRCAALGYSTFARF